MKLLKRILYFFCCCVCVVCAINCKEWFDRYELDSFRKFISEQRYIIHAGGCVSDEEGGQYTYTNSKEALTNCLKNKKRIIELDFMKTSDDYWVCAHDYAPWAFGYDFTEAQTYQEFTDHRFKEKLDSLTLEQVIDFLRENKEYYVVTDVKEDNKEACEYIRKHYPSVMNNFIIQIYHEEEYSQIRDMGFKHIIYTLYRCTSEELRLASLVDAADKYDLVGFTFPADYAKNDSFMKVMLDTKVPLLVHTINDKDEMKQYIDAGIVGIYTDSVDDNELYFE